jgi:hypothetical protein
MATHPQTWIKVNAPVDEGVAEIVSILNTVDGLETRQSCQGDGHDYVYFTCGDWMTLSQFVFEQIGPALKSKLDQDATLAVEATNADETMAKLSFRNTLKFGVL